MHSLTKFFLSINHVLIFLRDFSWETKYTRFPPLRSSQEEKLDFHFTEEWRSCSRAALLPRAMGKAGWNTGMVCFKSNREHLEGPREENLEKRVDFCSKLQILNTGRRQRTWALCQTPAKWRLQICKTARFSQDVCWTLRVREAVKS